jgi:hypothetical protein
MLHEDDFLYVLSHLTLVTSPEEREAMLHKKDDASVIKHFICKDFLYDEIIEAVKKKN